MKESGSFSQRYVVATTHFTPFKWLIARLIILKEYCRADHSRRQNKCFLSGVNQDPIFI